MITSNIREVMEDKQITYDELERRTGLTHQTISRVRGEMIRECKLSTLEAIARALGVRIYDLFDDGLGDAVRWEEYPTYRR